MQPDITILNKNLDKISYTLNKDYLSTLSTEYEVVDFDIFAKSNNIKYSEIDDKKHKENNTYYFKDFAAIKLNQLVLNKDEKSIDCMKNVLSTFSNSMDSLGFLIRRKHESVDLYIVFRKNPKSNENINDKLKLLEQSFKGNYKGSDVETISITQYDEDVPASIVNLKDSFDYLNEAKSISLLSAIPSDKSENFISQGLQKLLNGIVPNKDNKNEYTIMILAESINCKKIGEIQSGFEELATSITPFASHQFQKGENSSESNGEMKSVTHTDGTSHAISKTHSVNVGVNAGVSQGSGIGKSEITTNSSSNTKSSSTTAGGRIGGFSKSKSKTVGEAVAKGIINTLSRSLSLGISGGYGYSWGHIDTDSESDSNTNGTNHNVTLGNSENTTYFYKSYEVADILTKLENEIKRLNIGKSTGFWKTATYVLSNDPATTKNVANFMRGLSQGDESYIESSVIQTWSDNEKDKELKTTFREIRKYLTWFVHPIFVNVADLLMHDSEQQKNLLEEIKNKFSSDESKREIALKMLRESSLEEIICVSPTTNISTTELAKLFSLPNHSLPELPVLECAEFGRNVSKFTERNETNGENIELGNIYHMHNEESVNVSLDLNSLCSHTFITGSTGSGKSNTVYQILGAAKEKEKKFLVIEPAKGEYKNIFGKTAKVYGTNPDLIELLRINPFSFPNKGNNRIHILEHLDRLVEIFNVCWPMYAAMPAVLKEAVEKSYEDAGWNLIESTNAYGENLYPTFSDVARNIKLIIDSSEYDVENKGAYKGSLLTRLKSLTNGINGLIFTTNEIGDAKLFDENVIVDLSRVGSSETKSLIMGILVMKLQEYRMSQQCELNSDLKHITVLEEAHNLLKRTSTEQSSEHGNLLGKSVEMLANAIAEMRTYGEAFIIADQAPGLLDMSVIRNTNTKIIMRLPELNDRELVGKAANLSENQIIELAKLPCGVAAVYQNEWVQPVLCKVYEYKINEKFDSSNVNNNKTFESSLSKRLHIAELLCNTPTEKNIIEDMVELNFSGSLIVSCTKYINSVTEKPDFNKLSYLITSILPEFAKIINKAAMETSEVCLWRDELQENIEEILKIHNMYSDELRNNVLQCVIQNYICNELRKPLLLNEFVHGGM